MLQNEISVFVKERVISLQPNYTNPVAGNVDHDYLEVNFDHEWDNLDKRVTFYGVGANPITVPLDENDKVLIPWECMQNAGQMALTFVGSENGIDRLVTVDLDRDKRLRVVASGEDMGVSPTGPTEDLYERIKKLTEKLEGQVESGDFGLSFKELNVSQIDENGVPNISDPNPNIIYVAPASKNARIDESYEWFWIGSKWERFGKDYILPEATKDILGGIKIGNNLSIDENGRLNAEATNSGFYELPQASPSVLGGIKLGAHLVYDAGTGLTDAVALKGDQGIPGEDGKPGKDGDDGYTPVKGIDYFTTQEINDIKADILSQVGGIGDGEVTIQPYVLPIASDSTLGGIKIGKNLTITVDGTVSAEDSYELPQATETTLGGIKLGPHFFYDETTGITDVIPIPGDNGYTPIKGLDYFTQSDINEVALAAAKLVKPYTLPMATEETLGGVKVGNNLSIDEDGTLSAEAEPYKLPMATGEILGGLKLGNNMRFNAETGKVDVTIPEVEEYTLPTATDTTLGGIKVGDNLSVTKDGILSAVIPEVTKYDLPTASADTLGGVKIGNNLSIDEDGVLSAEAEPYELPMATDEILGGVKMGVGVTIIDGVISVSDDYINSLIETKLSEMYQIGHTWGDIEDGGFLQPIAPIIEE